MILDEAISELRKGRFILIYDSDDREGETDFVIASQYVTPEAIKTMRKKGGGLIFLMISHDIAKRFQLPFLADVYSNISDRYPVFKALVPDDIPYDTKSSFSVTLNHRNTFTGITDIDRSLTMKRFAEIVKKTEKLSSKESVRLLGKEFRSPGHIPVCIASEKPLQNRFGHTELVVSILKMANLTPVGSGCEIMGDNGKAMPKREVKKFAEENGYIFLEGRDIIEGWRKWLE